LELELRSFPCRPFHKIAKSDYYLRHGRPSVRMEQLGSHWKKYGRLGQATYDNIIRRMRVACWITKVTDTHSEYVILLLFRCNNGYANVPQCYVTCTLFIFLHFYTFRLLIIMKVMTMCQYCLF